jgi:class 3 adenylate cyclase
LSPKCFSKHFDATLLTRFLRGQGTNASLSWRDAFGTLLFVRCAAFSWEWKSYDQKTIDELHQRYYEAVFESSYAFGGEILLVIGSDVCAFFEEAKNKDHTVCAIDAAKKLETRLRQDAENGIGVKVTCGIHTDTLRIGMVGSKRSCL